MINREKYIEGPFDKEGLELFEFIRNNTSEKDVIVFYKPRVLRLLTGRNGFVVKTVSQITDGRGNILVIDKNAPNDLFPSSDQINSIKNHLHVVFENAKFSVYSIVKNW